MKHIIKQGSPEAFEQWKADFLATHGRKPTYSDFRGGEKHTLKYHLIQEQGSICCYCMKFIEFDCHIEHFIPCSSTARDGHSLDLSYENLLASCNGEHDDRSSCGHYKGAMDYELLLSPVEGGIEELFQYDILGNIKGVSTSAIETIAWLNLNSFELKRHRKTAIRVSGHSDDDDAVQKEFLMTLYANRDERGAFLPYCMAILYVMNNN